MDWKSQQLLIWFFMHFLYSSFFRKLFKQFCSLPIDTAYKLCYRAIMSAFIFTKADTVTMYVIYCFSRHCNCIFLEEEMRNQLSQRDDFYPQIVKLVIPIIIQNLLSAAVNSADVIMLNFVGQSSISAVSLAANYSNVLFMVYYGLGTGATLLCAQYYGKGDYKAIQIIEGIAPVSYTHLTLPTIRLV